MARHDGGRATRCGDRAALALLDFDALRRRVFTPATQETDPLLYRGDEWCLDGPDRAIPRLRHGYAFAGCRAGVLYAISFGPDPCLEHVACALWDLARRLWFVLIVALIAALL